MKTIWKKITAAVGVAILAGTVLSAQPCQDIRQLYGVYYIQDFTPYAIPPAPRGYTAVGISHYGRHGARYQDSEEAYTRILETLSEARSAGNLTSLGESVLSRVDSLYSICRFHHGELTPLGWEQHRGIAHSLVRAYPGLFKANAEVTATSSFSQRCMMSMQAFCLGLKEARPGLHLYAETSRTLLDQTNPGDKQNIRYEDAEVLPSPWGLSYEDHLKRVVSESMADSILLRLFKDKEALSPLSPVGWCQALYNLISGMGCTGPDLRIEDVFTEEELRCFYRAINYGFFQWGALSRNRHKPALKRMAEMAEEDLKAGHPVIRLRFGHDTILLGILHLLQAGTLGIIPDSVDALADTWNCYMTPMAAHFELVFYRSRKDTHVLVLPLLNGSPIRLSALQEKGGGFYDWDSLRDYIRGL